MEKSSTFIWIEYDKWLHLMVGYIVALTFGLFGLLDYGVFITLILAFAKEIRDFYTPGSRFDWYDIWWTLLGIIPAIFILLLQG